MKKALLVGLLTLAATLPRYAMAEGPSLEEKQVIRLINDAREERGLVRLVGRRTMGNAARAHAENMARQQQATTELDGKNGADRLLEAGYNYYLYQEAYHASNTYPSNFAEGAVAAMLASRGARKALLNPQVRDIGVGVRVGSNETFYYYVVTGNTGVQID